VARKDTATLKADAKKNLEARWKVVQAANLANDPFPAHKQVVSDLLRSGTKAYRYLAVSQVLAKLTDPEVDPRCLQAQCKHASGAFDARSFASSVVVPWEQANGGALGQSADPFVSIQMAAEAVLPEGLRLSEDERQAVIADYRRASEGNALLVLVWEVFR
jgi:hypothetical protein